MNKNVHKITSKLELTAQAAVSRMFDILVVLAALAWVHRAVLGSQEVCKEKEGGLNRQIYFGTFDDEDMACAQLCAKAREPSWISV